MPLPKEISVRRPAAHEVFTDREGERQRLRTFFEGLCATPMQRDKPILAFYGVGGVGKTSVKNEAIRKWRESTHPSSVKLTFAECDIDAAEFTPDQPILGFFGSVLRPALRKAGFTLPLFETFYCTWFGRFNPDTEMSKSGWLSGAIGVGEQSAELGDRLIDGLDALGSTFKGTALAFKAATAFRDWRRRRTLAETLPELDLHSLTPKQFDERAGDVLAVDLLTALGGEDDKALCIVIDGFERIQSRELRADLQNELQDLCARVLLSDPPERCGVVILGRERLRWRELYDEPDNHDNHWDLYIEHSLLGGLAEQDGRAFLGQVADWYRGSERTAQERRVGELVATHGDAILRQAEEDPDSDAEATYYPYSLDLAIEQVIRHSGDFDPKVLGQGAKDLQARFLRDMDRRQRSALQVLAVALEFDLELFKYLVKEGVIVDYPVHGLYELVAPSYVIEAAERRGVYRFHRKVLDALLADLMQRTASREQLAEIVVVLQAYFLRMLEAAPTADVALAARVFDQASAIVTAHTSAHRLDSAVALRALDSLENQVRHRYSFNLDSRVRTAAFLLDITSRSRSPAHADSLDRMNNLAWLLSRRGDNAAARVLLEKALAISAEVHGPESYRTRSCLVQLADHLESTGDYATSLAVRQRVLHISEIIEWPAALAVTLLLDLRAVSQLLCRMSRHAEAIPLLERELAVSRERFGPNNSAAVFAACNLIEALRTVGDTSRAGAIADLWLSSSQIESAVTAAKSDLSSGDAAILDQLAELQVAKGDFAAARSLYERSLLIRECTFGADRPETAQSLNKLSYSLRKLGQLDDARALCERAYEIFEQSNDPYTFEHLLSVAELDAVLSDQGDSAALVQLHERELAFCERVYSELHHQSVRTLCNLASCYLRLDDRVMARRCWTRALHISQKIFGPEHPKIRAIQAALQSTP